MRKHSWKLLTATVLAVALLCTAGYVRQSYYPMSGNVTLVEKTRIPSGYLLVIQQDAAPGRAPGARIRLVCSRSDAEAWEVGDRISCERTQSALTGWGSLHTLSEPVMDDFLASVLEVREGSMLVEPLEGEPERQSATRIEVPLPQGSPSFSPGDRAEIFYGGGILERYPAALSRVYAVNLFP